MNLFLIYSIDNIIFITFLLPFSFSPSKTFYIYLYSQLIASPLVISLSLSPYIICIFAEIYKYPPQGLSILFVCACGFRDDHFVLDNQLTGPFLEKANSPSLNSSQLFIISLTRVDLLGCFLPSMLACLLISVLFRYCLCIRFYEGLFHRILPGILGLIIFLPLLPRCSFSHRSRSCDKDVSTGLDSPKSIDLYTVFICDFLWWSQTVIRGSVFDKG